MTAPKYILILLSLIVINVKIQAQESDSIDNQEKFIDAIQGQMIDPIICNEIGIEILGGTENPNFGLGLEYKPIFLNKISIKASYRTSFKENQIFNSSIETKYLINQKKRHIDFRISYDIYNLDYSEILDNYSKLSLGAIYRFQWISYGISIVKDNYVENIGVDFSGEYKIHRLLYGSKNNYKRIGNIKGCIGYWNNELNYNFKFDYFINYAFNCGIGYQKIYDFDEIYFTLKYIIQY